MPDSFAHERKALLADDTTQEVERLQIDTWRVMSSLEKAELVSQASRAVLDLASVGIRQRYPAATEHEQFLRLAILTLGPALVRLTYPDAAELHDVR